MSARNYQNFDLLIDANNGAYRAHVIHSPAGEASTSFRLPLSMTQLQTALTTGGNSTRHLSPYSDNANGTSTLESLDPQTLGTQLFEVVFAGQVGHLFSKSLSRVTDQYEGIRIRLRLSDVPELVDLPWEYLYTPHLNRFLALSDETLLVRYLEQARPPEALRVSPPLSILGIVSHPSDVPQLAVEKEWQHLQHALAGLQERNLVTLERLPHATTSSLQDHLRQNPVHLLHYIGHGYFDQSGAGLVLEDAYGLQHRVTAHTLGMLLHDHTALRLVFLNACEGARSGHGAFSGVAQHLVEQGISAVVAMRTAVMDSAAIVLAQEFYEALSDGYPVDVALTQARKAVSLLDGAGIGDWGTPVIFSRSEDNQILELPQGDAQQNIERQWFEPETVLIPGGQFLMGSQPGTDIPEHEMPQHLVTLPAYRIGKMSVTNRQYMEFIRKTGRLIPAEALWNGQHPPQERLDQPVTGLDFYDAVTYCEW